MAGMKTLAGLLVIVAFIGQEAQGRVVKMVKETVYEVVEDNAGDISLETLFLKVKQNLETTTVCTIIAGNQVCAVGNKIDGGFNVAVTVLGQTILQTDVTTPNPAPVCQNIPNYGTICLEVYNVNLSDLTGCARLTALGQSVTIGCFKVLG